MTKPSVKHAQVHEVRQGDVVFIPAGTPHCYRAHAGAPFGVAREVLDPERNHLRCLRCAH